jgi:hypothetical protein
LTRAEAIAAKCKECIYDPEEDGTWRRQVKACAIESCALHPYRPMPYKVRNHAVQPEYKTIRDAVRVGSRFSQ